MAAYKYKWLLFLLLPLLSFQPAGRAADHPFFVSVVEVNHNAAEKSLEISVKIFTDDFEKTLGKKYNTKVDLTNPPDKAAMDKLVKDYISKNLSFKADGRALGYNYIGFEQESEAVWSYFEITGVAAVKKIDIINSILHDLTDKQINIMHVTVGGVRKSNKLGHPDTQTSFQF
jgi:hypothetical protein